MEQIEAIKQIIANGYAYEVNGSVYFSVRSFSEDHLTVNCPGGRLTNSSTPHENWTAKAKSGTPSTSPCGRPPTPATLCNGLRPGAWAPGWHLECSVMSTKYLGETFDIHGGGMDLKFPHHECEIAQNVAFNGESQPVKYWMHGNMLTVNGRKWRSPRATASPQKNSSRATTNCWNRATAP